jgi:transposase
MCGLVAYRPGQDDREEPATWMGFELLEGAYDTRQCIRVLDGLGHQLGHQPVTVIWDNLGAHHAGDLQAWAATQPWLALEYLPSYAPELDPVEGLWDARIDVKWRGAPRSRPGWRGRPRGLGSASRTA